MPNPALKNDHPALSAWRFWLFWAAIAVTGTTIFAFSAPPPKDLLTVNAALLVILGLQVLLELGPLFRGRGERSGNGDILSSSVMFSFALFMHWGLAAAIVGQAVSVIVEACLNRRALWRTIFNTTQFAVCFGAAQLVLLAFHSERSLAHPADIKASTLPGLLVAGAVFLAVNLLLVGTISALKSEVDWWPEVTQDIVSYVTLNDVAAVTLAPLVVVAAGTSSWLVPLLLVPLFAVYKGNKVSLQLQHQAAHDALTDLPNRLFLLERAELEFGEVAAGRSAAGLFVLDLDRFKEVNDTLGHPAGDRLLVVVAQRLLAAVRPGDLVARLGGDEFAVLLPDLVGAEAGRAVAARITNALRAPIRIDGVILNVDSSLGMALAPDHGVDFETLLQRADLAMYAAKDRGTSYEMYTPNSPVARRAD